MNLADKTLQAIRQLGWSQGDMATYHDPEDAYSKDPRDIRGVCLLGGLGWAAEKNPWALDSTGLQRNSTALRTIAAMEKTIQEQYPERLGQCEDDNSLVIVSIFNDHTETTLEDIEVVCKKASLRLEEEVV